jgi:antitoxin ParD1/3/4
MRCGGGWRHSALGKISAESYKASMAQMNISIPEQLKGWAEQRVAEGRYSSTSDYVRDLVRRDQEREEQVRRLQAAIDEGRASGISKRGIADIIADRRKQDGLD